jgi:hypothetical protein
MQIKNHIRFTLAVLIYCCFAYYLYFDHIGHPRIPKLLLPVNSVIAAAGCYILSRRWISGFTESLVAGAIFGFGPYFLGLSMSKFHPAAGLSAAVLPWLFLPAAYAAKLNKKWLGIPACLLPFIWIAIFSYLTSRLRLFVAPVQMSVGLKDLLSFFMPLVAASKGWSLLSFYHVPQAGLVFGLFMLIKARRIGILLIIAAAIALASYRNINTDLQICPLLWLAIPMLCGSIIIGTGLQGLASSGICDRTWVLYDIIYMCIAAIAALLLAARLFLIILSLGDPYAILLVKEALMYILGAIAPGIIYFVSSTNIRLHRLRELILTMAAALDIFLCARFITAAIF